MVRLFDRKNEQKALYTFAVFHNFLDLHLLMNCYSHTLRSKKTALQRWRGRTRANDRDKQKGLDRILTWGWLSPLPSVLREIHSILVEYLIPQDPVSFPTTLTLA